MIHREATIKYKGYDPDDLKPNSNKRICMICNNCGRVRWGKKSDYSNLCHKCANSGENNSMFGKHHTIKTKQKISIINKGNFKGDKNPMFGKHHTEKTKQKISIANEGKLMGDKNPMADPKVRQKQKENVRMACQDPKRNEKIRQAKLEYYSHEENIQKARERMLGENNPMFGQKHTKKTKQKMSESQSGKNNGNWKGGISSDRVKLTHLPEYEQWRKAVITRDNNICQECGTKIGVKHIHHILPFRDYPEPEYSLNVDNGITLCVDCHKETFGCEYDFMCDYLGKIFDNKSIEIFGGEVNNDVK